MKVGLFYSSDTGNTETVAVIIGHWPSEGYEFTDSKALIDKTLLLA